MINTHFTIAVPEDAVDEIVGGRDGCVSEDSNYKSSVLEEQLYSPSLWRSGARIMHYEAKEDDQDFNVCVIVTKHNV